MLIILMVMKLKMEA